MKKKLIILIGILSFLSLFLLESKYYLYLKAALFYDFQVQELGEGGFGNSIFLKENDDPVISYINKENKLILKEKVNGFWGEEVIEEDVVGGNNTKVAVGGNGELYVLYITKEGFLKLANRKFQKWNIEKIFDNAALSCNLKIKDGDIYLSFWSPEKGLGYGQKKGDNWKIEIIDYGRVGWWNSLAVDSNGYPHISYFDFKNKDLLYLSFDGTFWSKEVVDSQGEVGYWNSIVVGGNERVYISYFDRTNGKLKLAQKSQGGWQIETVDKDGIVGERTNILLNKSENPVIAYSGLSDNSFRVAKRESGNWQINIISSDREASQKNIRGEGSLDNSIVMDPAGKFYFLWFDLFKEKLYYFEGEI